MTNVVREINFFFNSRERNLPSLLSNPASVCTWSLDVPITLQRPQNYFQISVRGFYADPGLVCTYQNNGQNWIRAHKNGVDVTAYLPRGNYTNQTLVDWLNAVVVGNLGAGFPNSTFATLDNNGYCNLNEGSCDPTAIEVDFSVTMWRAFGFGASYYGYTEAAPSGPFNPSDTGFSFNANTTYRPPFPMQSQPNRTLFVLFNGGVLDNFSTSTSEFQAYPGGIEGGKSGSWPLGLSGGYKERRCIAAISLLSGNATEKIDYSAQNFVYTQVSSPVISFISIALATENYKIVPIEGADYTIVLAVQECAPIAQSQLGIPQPIVLPKKEKEKDNNDEKKGDDEEEYIRQLAQQIKQRRLQRAADMVDKSE